MSLGQIIRQKREELGYTLDEVSYRIGFSKPYLSTIETGRVKNPPSDEMLIKLEKLFEVEEGLLRHIAHMERLPSDIRKKYESQEVENEKLRSIVKNLIEDKKIAVKFKRVINKRKLQNIRDITTLTASRLVPVINRVMAGYPHDFNDLDYPVGIADDYVRCPDIHDPNAFAVRVVGDSMEPKFHEGDIVIFSPSAEVTNGDDCFIRFTSPHETTFKQVYFDKKDKIRLQPRNDDYKPTIMDGQRIDGIYKAVMRYEKL